MDTGAAEVLDRPKSMDEAFGRHGCDYVTLLGEVLAGARQ